MIETLAINCLKTVIWNLLNCSWAQKRTFLMVRLLSIEYCYCSDVFKITEKQICSHWKNKFSKLFISLNYASGMISFDLHLDFFSFKDTRKAFDNFKNKQNSVWSNVFLIYKCLYILKVFNTLYIEIKYKC